MELLKQQALDRDDSVTVEHIQNKMNIIQLQLDKMNDQFSTDVLQNSISQWQLEFVSLANSSAKLSELNVLVQQFHTSFINLVKGIPLGYYDSLIRALLILFPHDLPDHSKSPFGWEFLARKVNPVILRNQDSIELLKTMVVILVMDVVSILIGGSSHENIRKETYDLTLRHIFHYIHTLAGRKIPENEGVLIDKAFTRCAITVGYISNFSQKDIVKHLLQNLDPSKKLAAEEQVLGLSLLRYSFAYPPSERQTLETVDFIKELITLCDKNKKSAVKNAIIQLIERVIQPHQAEGPRKPEETMIWTEIQVLYKKARKWAGVDELKENALHLMTMILVNSRIDFFASNIDAFINTDLCSKQKVRPYAYRCILQLLRGRYYQDTLQNYEDAINGDYVIGRHFASLTRAVNEQSSGTVSNRLNSIAEMMFFRRKYPIPEEHLDTCTNVIVQIAAHSITLGAKLITQLLGTTRVDHSKEFNFIGLRSLRTILDPQSGFQKFASSKRDQEFDLVVKDFAYDVMPSISSIYEYIESQIGVSVTGPSGQVLELPDKIDMNGRLFDPDTAAASATKALSQSMTHTVLDDGEESSPTLQTSLLRKSRADLTPTSPSMKRASLIGSIPNLLSAPISSDLLTAETPEDDDYISKTLTGWFDAVGSRGKNVLKYSVQSTLIDRNKIKKHKGQKISPEQKQAFSLLQEIILVIQYVPSPEFIGGNYFIGAYLPFFREDIAKSVATTFINIFKNFPDLRLGIINGFINYLKRTKVRDGITMCTNLVMLSRLVQTWIECFDPSKSSTISTDGFYRVSCKVDAYMLFLMCHPNGKMRSTCLKIVLDFYKLQKEFLPHGTKPGEMPLAYILLTSETLIVKQAIYAFLESSSRGHNLSARIASSLHPLTLLEVASSSFSGLFQYYHGELVKRFSFCGRPKAIRHLAKHLKNTAPSMIHENPDDPTDEYVMYFGSIMVLLMAMAGVPVTSEVEYVHRPKKQEEAKFLLFASFRGLIPFLLTLDKGWAAKAIFRALYFLHRDVIELFISEMIDNFQEVRHSSKVVITSRFLDNIFFMLRYVIQYPHFELLLEEDAIHSKAIVSMYSDFINFSTLAAFVDNSFLSEGPELRVKTAINVCIITQRLCYCLKAVKRKLFRQGKFDGNMIPLQKFEATIWSANLRRGTVNQMKEWYEAIRGSGAAPSTPKVPTQSVDIQKLNNLKTKLLVKIGLAMEQLMALGGVFVTSPLPPGLLPWMATLQGEGFKVFTPEFLLYFEDALGTALASSYGGIGSIPMSFCNAIYEELLPLLDDGPHMYLFGNSRRMSFAEGFVAASHSLPPANADELSGPSFIHPDIRAEEISKLRNHAGSLLFFSLYNLMHTNVDIRNKSLTFLRELLHILTEGEEIDVESHILPHIGGFYSSVGSFLKEKILQLSTLCSELFASESSAFLWEAVRCVRSLKLNGKKQLLVNQREWSIALMIPWCQYVDLGSINVDVVHAEFFQFLMDAAFDDPLNNEGIVNCWGEVAKSPEHGAVNASVLMDVVIGVCGRFPNLENAAFTMASTLASIQPDLITTVLTYHLSSAAFPWNQSKSNQTFQHTSQLAIKDYISSLYEQFKSSPPESQNDYRLNRHSAALISSAILTQQFESFSPYLNLLINYLFIHLEDSLRTPLAHNLLTGLINGLISFLHHSGQVDSDIYPRIQNVVRKVLGWLELANPRIIWSRSSELPTNGFQVTEIPMDEFAERLICIFEVQSSALRMQLIEEVIHWSAEGFLGTTESLHAIQCYQYYVSREDEIPVKYQNLLLSRILDQVAVLSQIELEAKVARTDTDSGWNSLPQGKITLRDDSLKIIIAILDLHKTLLVKFKNNGTLESHGKLFWTTVGLLHFSSKDFPEVVSKAMKNILFFFEHMDRSKLDNYFMYPLDTKEGRSCDIQSLLIPHIFDSNVDIQDMAVRVLLNSWIVFPAVTVDANKTGLLYSILYTIPWIFSKALDSVEKESLLNSIEKIEQFLVAYFPKEIEYLHLGIDRMKEFLTTNPSLPNEAQQVLFKQCFTAIFEYFIRDFGNNIAQFIAQIISIKGTFHKIGLKMTGILWKTAINLRLDLNKYNQIKVLIKGIPFIKQNSMEKEELILMIFEETGESKDVDVASQGRFEPLPSFECSPGSVRAAWSWIHTDLGIQSSNRMYELM